MCAPSATTRLEYVNAMRYSRAMAWKKAPVTWPRRPPALPSACPCPSMRSTQRLVVARRGQRRIVKFVAAYRGAGRTERARRDEPRRAIAEMQLAGRKTRGVSEQAGHGMAHAVGILEPRAQHHVAAALPMHRPRRRKSCKSVAKPPRIGERAGMKLRIAAGQPATVAVGRRRLVGKRRERHDLGARAAPAVDHMGIDEREGPIRARARPAAPAAAAPACSRCRPTPAARPRRGSHRDRDGARHVGEAVEPGRKVGVLAGLHQAEMAFRHRQRRVARHRAEHRHSRMPPSHRRRARDGARCRRG